VKAPDGADALPKSAPSAPLDADLTRIVEAWPSLPEAMKRAVLAMVEVAWHGS
jgi:hypothetical protein